MVIRQVIAVLISNCLWLLFLGSRFVYAGEADLNCLRTIKQELQDPNKLLSNWVFGNSTAGYICKFSGVDCWHDDENRVLNIKLSGFGLKGSFPLGLGQCSGLTGLDLSRNELSGSLPSNISMLIGSVTSLDLSFNQFSGEIPLNLANCSYLNTLRLDNNRFSGSIPLQLGQLGRIKEFSVANNLLIGPVPEFTNASSVAAESYANNPGLCGKFLDPCGASSKGSNPVIIGVAAAGGITIAAVAVGIGAYFYFRRRSVVRKKDDDPEGNKWAKSLIGKKGTKVSMLENSVSKMKLNDLMKATNNFNKSNIIGTGRTGTTYKGLLEDGTPLMVKRLQNSLHSENEFTSEMETLGKIRHRNLVTLFGFCIADKERLLVYDYMPNGTLYDCLHPSNEAVKPMDWQSRLKVGIRAAKGFAWLHHSCNPRIIHRNISSSCILLDANFDPKISDFGLARLMNPIDTHMSTFVNGEFGDLGYVAPEYARTLKATPKGDIYSFGVVLLELVTGEKPTDVAKASEENFKGNLVEWITKLSGESKLQRAIDKTFVGMGVDDEMFKVLKVACNCVLSAPKERPTMFEVYQLLRAIGENYQFTTEDDLLMLPTESGDANDLEELIVAR